ncbi:MAG: hypothetical protein RL095_1112 [Verrucomicrobiota bacterium]|jgi:lysophospholipase L1-like esterase
MTITLSPRNIALSVLAVTLLGWLLWPAGDPLWPVAKLPQAPTRVVVFGDSLTTGYQLHDAQKSFPLQLGRRLGLPVQVEGINGCTLPAGEERLERLDFGPPCLVLVCLGGNDQLRGVDPKRSAAALEAILGRLRAKGHAVAFVEVLAPFSGRKKEWRRICREQQVALAPDVMDGFFSDPEKMQPDNIHPNEIGCALLAERTHRALLRFGLLEGSKP